VAFLLCRAPTVAIVDFIHATPPLSRRSTQALQEVRSNPYEACRRFGLMTGADAILSWTGWRLVPVSRRPARPLRGATVNLRIVPRSPTSRDALQGPPPPVPEPDHRLHSPDASCRRHFRRGPKHTGTFPHAALAQSGLSGARPGGTVPAAATDIRRHRPRQRRCWNPRQGACGLRGDPGYIVPSDPGAWP